MQKLYATLCLLCVSFFQVSIASELPELGNSANAVLSPAKERALGQSVMKELATASVLSQDMIVNEYLQGIGHRLISLQSQHQNGYTFFAVNDRTINAFALPGGFIGVNTGLILATEGESELAGVLAHEIGHVQQKHIARMYQHMGRLRLPTIAGIIASLLIATQNPEVGSGALVATLAGNQQALINFTRDHEKEADFVGIYTLAKAGFDPMGMPAFFHRMYQDTRFYGNHVPEYLLTHPLTEARLMAAQMRAKDFPYKQISDSLQYHLIQARVLLHSFNSPQEAKNHFAKKLSHGNYRSELGTRYGYALALIATGSPSTAKSHLNTLRQVAPNQPLFELAYAECEMITGQSDAALSRLANTLKNHPNHFPLIITYIDWLTKTGSTASAIRLLKQQISRKPNRSELWHLLCAAHVQAHQPLQAHIAQAHYLTLQGDLSGATTQLTLAKKISPLSSQEEKQIEAQLKEIEKKMAKSTS